MGYISFYRKWRPQTFDEIVGQKYNVQTLKNVLDGKRLSHSYIFCGPRGTGKTSTARILAKAINCVNGISSTPCNECKNCTSISDGSNVDVIEIDAASNRGINEIRELREKVKYLPNNLAKKIYIIDEVHMLTTEAFNALLKVLEEPPEHVVFIMATTEPNKVIPTIMSRCQRFDFYPIPLDLIKKRLAVIARNEKVPISDDALGLVAKYADGSLRDADGILEQLAAYSEEKIGPQEVVDLLGVVDIEILFEFVDMLAARDVKKGLEMTGSIIRGNQDLKNFTSELMDHLYNLYVIKNYDKPPQLIDLSRDYLDKYQAQAGKLQNEELEYYLEHFTSLLKQVRWGESSKTFFKSSVIQAINYIVLDDRQLQKKARAWDARLDAIERKINEAARISQDQKVRAARVKDEAAKELEVDLDIIKKDNMEGPSRSRPAGIVSDEDAARAIEKGSPGQVGQAGGGKGERDSHAGDEVKAIEENMDTILEALKKKKISVYAMFVEAGPGHIEDGILYFYLDESKKWHKDHLNKTVNSALISSVINEVTGKKYGVRFETGEVSRKNGKTTGVEEPEETEEPAETEEPPQDREPPERISEEGDRYKAGRRDTGKGRDNNNPGQQNTGKEMEGRVPEINDTGDDDVIKYFEKKFDIKE